MVIVNIVTIFSPCLIIILASLCFVKIFWPFCFFYHHYQHLFLLLLPLFFSNLLLFNLILTKQNKALNKLSKQNHDVTSIFGFNHNRLIEKKQNLNLILLHSLIWHYLGKMNTLDILKITFFGVSNLKASKSKPWLYCANPFQMKHKKPKKVCLNRLMQS